LNVLFWLEGTLLAAVLWLFGRLSPVAASNAGGALARVVGPLLPVSAVAKTNLRRAMPEMDAGERRRVVRGVWDNLGRVMGEFPHLAGLRQTASGPGWETVGGEALLEVAARGGPAIVFSGHLGNWEMTAVAAAANGIPLALIYRGAKNPYVDRVVRAYRQRASGEAPLFAKGVAGARGALAYLKAGGFVGMLMDQKMNDGIPARFFGEQVMTAPALAVLALRLRCPVIPGYVERLGPARFRIVVEPPLALPATGVGRTDVTALTQMVNDRLEAWIRARPESWLWLHRRWPLDPSRVAPPH